MRERFFSGKRGEAIAVVAAFTITAVVLVWQAIQVRSYVWLVDELLYVKGALGVGDGLLPGHVYGQASSVANPLYVWAIAPIFKLLPSEQAFVVAHAFGALVFAGVIFPVYLTARRLGATAMMAVLAGLLAVWVPWSVSTLTLMSEPLAYFMFAWSVWAMTRALPEPTIRNELAAFALLGVTAYTRPQFILMVPVFLLAILFCELRTDDATLRDRLLRRRVAVAVATAGALAVAVLGDRLLGAYSATAAHPVFPSGILASETAHAAYVIVGVGLVPAIAWLGWALRAGAKPLNATHLGFAVLSALLVAMIWHVSGFFGQAIAGGQIQERYVFYVVALFALGLAALSADDRSRGPRLSMIVAGAIVAAVVGPTYGVITRPGAFTTIQSAAAAVSETVAYHLGRVTRFWPFGDPPTNETLAGLAIAIGVVVTVLATPRWRRVGVPLLATGSLLFGVIETGVVLDRATASVNITIPRMLGPGAAQKSWADDGTKGGEIGLLPSPLPGELDRQRWLWIEFWNKHIAHVYTVGKREQTTNLPHEALSIDPANGNLQTAATSPYLVVSASDPGFAVRGRRVARGPFGTELIKPADPQRVLWLATAGDGAPLASRFLAPGRPVELHIYRPPGTGEAAVSVDLTLAGTSAADGRTEVIIRGVGGARKVRIAPGRVRRIAVRSRIPAGAERATVRIVPSRAGASRRAQVELRAVRVG